MGSFEMAEVLILATAATGLVTALLTAWQSARKVEQVHRIVNSQHDELIGWAKELVERLEREDLDIPPPPESLSTRARRRTGTG